MFRQVLSALAVVALGSSYSMSAHGKGKRTPEEKEAAKIEQYKKTHDPEDGAIDISGYLDDTYGIMPIPFVITEPAVNYGGGLAVIYFVPSKDGKRRQGFPDMVGVMGAGTGNRSWATAGYYMGFLNKDTIRLKAVAGYTSVNLDFYIPTAVPIELPMNFKGAFGLLESTFRIPSTPLFVGARWMLFGSTQSFPDNEDLENINSSASNQGIVFGLDNRDTLFTPTSGTRGELSILFSAPLAEQKSYWSGELYVANYESIGKHLVLGLRGLYATAFAADRVPIYARPFVQMRGVPLARYQGQHVLQAEMELRFRITKRWDIVPFGGVATALNERLLLDGWKGDVVWSAGGGVRYQIARKYGLSVGIDAAASNSDWGIYTVMGSAWR